jgi:hypothetical protein
LLISQIDYLSLEIMNLHIITLNIPYPPDYGGMIDTYYRIRALYDIGMQVHLHCFEYGRPHSKELESVCTRVDYYPRKTGFLSQLSRIPSIVLSRDSDRLLSELNKDEYPVLFDGLHTTLFLDHPSLAGRKRVVRLHNIEHKYYHSLADDEINLFKRMYYLIESAKLKRYEKVLEQADYILPISVGDQEYFGKQYRNSVLLAPFHPFSTLKSLSGTGEFILYHGDLSLNENSAMADLLISNVFSRISFKCVIAGKDPPQFLRNHASRYRNIVVVDNPDNKQIDKLIEEAQIHLLPALASNGFKIKLIIALYGGRHIIVNHAACENTSIKNLCHISESWEEMISKIHLLMHEPFTEKMISQRRDMLGEQFDVRKNAKKLVDVLF